MTDPVALDVRRILREGAERAYGYRPCRDDVHDPDLCARCQQVRPIAGQELCQTCADSGGGSSR